MFLIVSNLLRSEGDLNELVNSDGLYFAGAVKYRTVNEMLIHHRDREEHTLLVYG